MNEMILFIKLNSHFFLSWYLLNGKCEIRVLLE
jgi:hypothetical protein